MGYTVYHTTITLYGEPQRVARLSELGILIIIGGLITLFTQVRTSPDLKCPLNDVYAELLCSPPLYNTSQTVSLYWRIVHLLFCCSLRRKPFLGISSHYQCIRHSVPDTMEMANNYVTYRWRGTGSGHCSVHPFLFNNETEIGIPKVKMMIVIGPLGTLSIKKFTRSRRLIDRLIAYSIRTSLVSSPGLV